MCSDLIAVSPRSEVSSTIKLYKYISFEALKGLIEYGDFRVTYRKDCNDPLEMLPAGKLPGCGDLREERGFISLTQCANNLTMWGNYADKFQGARIGFEFPYYCGERLSAGNKEEKHIHESLKQISELGLDIRFFQAFSKNGEIEPSGISRLLIKCIYVIDNERVHYPPASESIEKTRIDAERFWWSIMCTKAWDWRHEEEYRMPLEHTRDITRSNTVKKSMMKFSNIPTPYIKSIILGPKCQLSQENVEDLIAIKRSQMSCGTEYLPKDVLVAQARYNKTSFKLHIPEK